MQGQRTGCVRVSTSEQNVERQLEGVELDRVFSDRASGKDAARPELKAALCYGSVPDGLTTGRSPSATKRQSERTCVPPFHQRRKPAARN